MKKLAVIFLALAAFAGCATSAYDTFRAREGEYDAKNVALNPVGLTAEQIKTFLVGALTKAANVERVVPLPPFALPAPVTFEAVQQLGVRTLSEYSLLVFGDAFSAARWRKLAEGKYTFNSLVDFMLVDNETTAVIAADKLISTVDVKIEIFNDAEYRKAKKLLFTEQARILTEKMDDLFVAAGK